MLNEAHTDTELMELISLDDQVAFAELYNRYSQVLLTTALKVLHIKEEAMDAVQDVFLAIWARRKTLKIEKTVAGYLHTSIKYKALQFIEKNITRNDYLNKLNDVAVQDMEASAEIKLQLKQIQETIQQVVAAMPPKMQAAYTLSRSAHLTHREIAEKLQISDETVKKHIQYALKLIKTAISKSEISMGIIMAVFKIY